MSEQNSSGSATDAIITDDDLIDFWHDRGAKANCEICSANDWMNTAEIEGHRPRLYAHKSGDDYKDTL